MFLREPKTKDLDLRRIRKASAPGTTCDSVPRCCDQPPTNQTSEPVQGTPRTEAETLAFKCLQQELSPRSLRSLLRLQMSPESLRREAATQSSSRPNLSWEVTARPCHRKTRPARRSTLFFALLMLSWSYPKPLTQLITGSLRP